MGDKRRVLHTVHICPQVAGAGKYIPGIEPRFEERHVPRVIYLVVVERRLSRVMKGTDHPCYVDEGRAFEPAFTDAPRRLSLEIDENEILSGKEGLAEMEVAMYPAFHGREAPAGDALHAGQHLLLGGQHLLCQLLVFLRKFPLLPGELLEIPADEAPHRLVHGTLIQGRKLFHGPGSVVPGGSEGDMHLRSPSPQDIHHLPVEAAQQFSVFFFHSRLGRIEQRGKRCRRLRDGLPVGEQALDELG